MNKWWIAFSLFLVVIACSQVETPESPKVEKPAKHAVINGVERSELAITMRFMYDQLLLTRDSLKNGYKPSRKLAKRVASIHHDVATEPEKIDETYHAMADLFLRSYSAFENDSSNNVTSYNIMIETCVACHQQKCPGPVKAIKKLHVKAPNS